VQRSTRKLRRPSDTSQRLVDMTYERWTASRKRHSDCRSSWLAHIRLQPYHSACPNQELAIWSAFLLGLSEIQTSTCSASDAIIGRPCADGPNYLRSWMKAATHSDLLQNLCASITRKHTWFHRTDAQTRSRSRHGFYRLSITKMKSASSRKSASCSICLTGSLSIAHDSPISSEAHHLHV
jgi:hypothetical protein